MEAQILSIDELRDFFRKEHAAYTADPNVAEWMADRRTRIKELKDLCLYQDPHTGKLFKTRVALELPAAAKELTVVASEEEIRFELKISNDKKEIEKLCPPGTLFFDLDAPPFIRMKYEDPLKWQDRTHDYLQRIDPGLASLWLSRSSTMVHAAAVCMRYKPADGLALYKHAIFERHSNNQSRDYLVGHIGLPSDLIEYAPPLPQQFGRFLMCHEAGHSNQPPYTDPEQHREFRLLIEGSADKKACISFLAMGGSPRLVEANLYGRAVFGLLAPNGFEDSKTAWLLDNPFAWADTDAENVLGANKNIRKYAHKNLNWPDWFKSWGATISIKLSDELCAPLIRSTRDLLYGGNFNHNPVLQRVAELAVEGALDHCPSIILNDLPLKSEDTDNFDPAEARDRLKRLIMPTSLAA